MLPEEEPEESEEETEEEKEEEKLVDTCQNPFFPCTSTEPRKIAVDIVYKGQRLSICQDCWEKLAESDVEWSSESNQKEDN